jgi:hypothetical protein
VTSIGQAQTWFALNSDPKLLFGKQYIIPKPRKITFSLALVQCIIFQTDKKNNTFQDLKFANFQMKQARNSNMGVYAVFVAQNFKKP